MSFLNVMLDPVPELLAQPGVDDVRQPLPWKQMELLFIWQITHELGVLLGLREHAFYRDVLVLRTVNFKVLVCLDA